MGTALGLTSFGAIVRARVTIDSVTEGGAGVTIAAGDRTVFCTAGRHEPGDLAIYSNGMLASAAPVPFPVVGVPIFVQIARPDGMPTFAACQITSADQSQVSNPASSTMIGAEPMLPSVGFAVRGASVTLDYVAVLAPAS